jgi:predicted O-linked N-acetylglucosamine transferase (SPINDLY family)
MKTDTTTLLQQAVNFLQRGDLAAAANATQAALSADASQPDGWLVFAYLLQRTGNLTGAEEKVRHALGLGSPKPAYFVTLLDILLAQDKQKEALHAAHEALTLFPQDGPILLKLAEIHTRTEQFPDAARRAENACQVQPTSLEAWVWAYNAYYRMGEHGKALSILEKGIKAHPTSLRLKLAKATLFPAILMEPTEAQPLIEKSLAELRGLQENPKVSPLEALVNLPFYQSYYGVDVKPYMEGLSGVLRKLFPSLTFTAPYLGQLSAKPLQRIAFFSEHIHGHVVSKYFSPMIRQLAEECAEYEIIVFTTTTTEDQYVHYLKSAGIPIVYLPRDIAKAQQRIADLSPDILVYLDIGMGVFSYLLAHARLAPVQCVAAGHPITSGISTLDYFFSARLADNPSPTTHYIESPVLFESLPILFSPRPEMPTHFKTREDLGLPERKILYSCPVYLHRLHPDMDEVFKALLQGDPEAEIILFDMYYPTVWASTLQERWNKHMSPALAARIHVLPYAQGPDFIHYMVNMDAVIDPLHFSMGTTLCALFAAGIPVITCPGAFMRSGFTKMLYELMQLEKAPIAADAAGLAILAHRFAHDKPQQQQLRKSILERHPLLYGNRQILDEWKAFFQKAWASQGKN